MCNEFMEMIKVEQMSTSECLRVISPVWHGEILADRKQRIESVEASFLSIEEAKEKLLR